MRVELVFNASPIAGRVPCASSTDLSEAHRASTLLTPRPPRSKLNLLGLQCTFNRSARACRVWRHAAAPGSDGGLGTGPLCALVPSEPFQLPEPYLQSPSKRPRPLFKSRSLRAALWPRLQPANNAENLQSGLALPMQVVMGLACQMRVQAMYPGAITETAWSGWYLLQGEGIPQHAHVSCEGMHPRASADQESTSRHLFCISASTWRGGEQAHV